MILPSFVITTTEIHMHLLYFMLYTRMIMLSKPKQKEAILEQPDFAWDTVMDYLELCRKKNNKEPFRLY